MDESTILREGCGTILLPDVTLLELVGADALEWLQGQVTNDVRPLGEGQPVSFCLCQPTGQIVSVIDAWPGVGRILLACPRETKQGVLDRVEQMVIMEEVEAKDLSSTQMLISLQGRKASLSEPGLPSDRCGFGGVDIWIDRDDKAAIERLLS